MLNLFDIKLRDDQNRYKTRRQTFDFHRNFFIDTTIFEKRTPAMYWDIKNEYKNFDWTGDMLKFGSLSAFRIFGESIHVGGSDIRLIGTSYLIN